MKRKHCTEFRHDLRDESYKDLPQLESEIMVMSDNDSGDKRQCGNRSIVPNFENSLESTKFVRKTVPMAIKTVQVLNPIVDLNEITVMEADGTLEKITTNAKKRKLDDQNPSSSEIFDVSHTVLDEIEFEDGNVDEIPKKKFINKGRGWAMFKPTKKNYLYFKIIQDLENVQEIVEDWISLYKTDYQKAVYQFFQFTIDICGYQKFDITTIFSLEVENYAVIAPALRENLTKAQKEGKCLFKAKSMWAKKVQTVICNFFIKLIEVLYKEKLLFKDQLMQYIFIMFVNFTLTNVRVIFYTGSIIVCKICSAFLNIAEELENMDLQTTRELLNNQICIKKYINFCLKIFKKTWMDDNFLMGMKLAVLKNMGKWFERNLSVVKNHISKLLFFLEDSLVSRLPQIRITALGTCEQLISLKNFNDCVGRLMPDFIDVIADRIDDIDYIAAIRAVQLLIKIDPLLIPGDIGNKVNCLVYNQFYPLAKISGNFFSHILKSIPTFNSFRVLKYLVQFHQSINNTHGLTPLLVESLFPWLDEIKDVELMIQILLNDKFKEREDQIVLIEILNNSMRQMITNKCKFVRIHPLTGKVNETEVQNALVCFISKYLPLYDKFCAQKDSKIQLLEILLFIDYKNLNSNIFHDNIFEITKRLILNFDGINNEETLLIVGQFLAFVKNFNSNDVGICNEVLTLTQKTTRIFIEILLKAKQNSISSEDNLAMECNLLHFSVLIQYHDLIPSIKASSLLFKLLSKLMKSLESKATIYIMKICSYYLIWKLKSVVTNAKTLNPFPKQELQSLTQNVISHYFAVLGDKANTLIYQPIFESLIEFVLEFKKVIGNLENISNDDNIEIVFDKGQNVLFMENAIKILFTYQLANTLVKRKQIFHNILTLVHFKIVGLGEVAKLLQYYFECYSAYGEILDAYLKALRDVGSTVVSGMIVHTLIYFYSNNVIKGGVMKYDKYPLFMNLLEHFRKFVGRHKKEVIEILKLAIIFISQSVDRYPFLFYIKRFTLGLAIMVKRRLVLFLFAKIPKQDEDNLHVVDFMNFCKIKIVAEPNSITENSSRNEENK